MSFVNNIFINKNSFKSSLLVNFFETYRRHQVISVFFYNNYFHFLLVYMTLTCTLSARNHRLVVLASLENTKIQHLSHVDKI